jgi:acyl-CoA dehydrogenase
MAYDADTRDQLIDMVRRFAAERLRPIEAKVAEDDAIPDDVIEDMKALGLYGLSIPEEYGGLDLSMEDECLVAIELGRVSPAFRSAFGTNVGIGSQGLVMFGTEDQKRRWLPRPDRTARRCRRGPCATATTTSSPAPSGTSPTPTAPASSR